MCVAIVLRVTARSICLHFQERGEQVLTICSNRYYASAMMYRQRLSQRLLVQPAAGQAVKVRVARAATDEDELETVAGDVAADQLFILVIAGTTRVQRQSIHAARFVAAVGRTLPGVHIEFVDPNDFHLPGDGNDPEGKDPRYSALTARADALFVVTPEYNHSFPGSLKRLLDSELGNYVHKPVAFAGASSGHWGGVRAVEALVGTVREMGLVATYTDVYFPNVQDMFEGGKLKPELRERTTAGVKAAYEELLWMARALKAAREATA